LSLRTPENQIELSLTPTNPCKSAIISLTSAGAEARILMRQGGSQAGAAETEGLPERGEEPRMPRDSKKGDFLLKSVCLRTSARPKAAAKFRIRIKNTASNISAASA
jgi:hypothetical protein